MPPNPLQGYPTADFPGTDDWLYLQGTTNDLRKLSPFYYQKYANDAYLVVPTTNDAEANGLALRDIVDASADLLPNGLALSASNRGVIILPPGVYDLAGNMLQMTSFVDMVSLTSDPKSCLITSEISAPGGGGTVVMADNVRLKGLWIRNTGSGRQNTNATDASALSFTSAMTQLCVITDCIFDDNGTSWAMRLSTDCSMTFARCVSGERSYGFNGNFSGAATDCVGGDYSFGYGSVCSAPCSNCIGGDLSFGANGQANGRFFRCYGREGSFGGSGQFAGIAEMCRVATNGFGNAGVFSGLLINCIFDTIGGAGSPWAPTTFTGLVSGVRFAQLASNLNAVTIPNGGTGTFEFCTFIKTGTGIPMGIAAAGSATIKFSYCKFNTSAGIESGITNALGATLALAFNIGSTDVE